MLTWSPLAHGVRGAAARQYGLGVSLQALVIGGGPAGLMAAETLAVNGHEVVVVDRMRTPGRKFILAGRGGLNVTHSESLELLLTRYTPDHDRVRTAVQAHPPSTLRAWVAGLGEDTFVGTSGRVFPESFNATPLLRAWLDRLIRMGVVFEKELTWRGFDEIEGRITHRFERSRTKEEVTKSPASTVFALGGATWPGTGSDGTWVEEFRRHNVHVAALVASNCGFRVEWSDVFRQKHAGMPLKNVALTVSGLRRKGELLITETGIEGGLAYASGHDIRVVLRAGDGADVEIDLRADVSVKSLVQSLSAPRGSQSTSTWLHKRAHLSGAAIGLLRESTDVLPAEPGDLARLIKAVPLHIDGPTGLARAISTAGGIDLDETTEQLMLRKCPGVFVAGEMLDWDAPTGGYLLQASWSTGIVAGVGASDWLTARSHDAELTASS